MVFSGTDVDSAKLAVDYIDLKAIAESTSPSSTYYRLFRDTADSKIKIKLCKGDRVIIE
jgi:hypothetical protein